MYFNDLKIVSLLSTENDYLYRTDNDEEDKRITTKKERDIGAFWIVESISESEPSMKLRSLKKGDYLINRDNLITTTDAQNSLRWVYDALKVKAEDNVSVIYDTSIEEYAHARRLLRVTSADQSKPVIAGHTSRKRGESYLEHLKTIAWRIESIADELNLNVNAMHSVGLENIKKHIQPISNTSQLYSIEDVRDVFHQFPSSWKDNVLKTKDSLNRFFNNELHAALKNEMIGKARKYYDLVRAITSNQERFPSGISDKIHSAISTRDNKMAAGIFSEILECSPDIKNKLSELVGNLTISIEVSGAIDLLVGVDGSIGFAISPTDLSKLKFINTYGVTAGAEEGGEVSIEIGISPQPPEEQSGPFAAFLLDAAAGPGVGLAIYLNLPDLSFAGISFSPQAGEELQLAAGAGYTFEL